MRSLNLPDIKETIEEILKQSLKSSKTISDMVKEDLEYIDKIRKSSDYEKFLYMVRRFLTRRTNPPDKIVEEIPKEFSSIECLSEESKEEIKEILRRSSSKC